MSAQLVSTQQQELGWSSGLKNSSQAKKEAGGARASVRTSS